MSDDINAQILAELKQMNESLAYIKAVAQRLNQRENGKEAALRDMMTNLPRVDR